MRGTPGPGTKTYSCGKCDQVLLENFKAAVVGMAVECADCGAINAYPQSG